MEVMDLILFKPGLLTAKAQGVTAILRTAKEPASISINAVKLALINDGYDVMHIALNLVDKDGTSVTTDGREICFQVEGEVRLLG